MGSIISSITGLFGTAFSSITGYIIAGLIALLVVFGIIGYFYYENTQSQLQILNVNVAKLTLANQQDQITITAETNFAKSQAAQIVSLQTAEEQAQTKYNNLENILQNQNITQEGQTDPSTLETQLNTEAATLLNQITAATQISTTGVTK